MEKPIDALVADMVNVLGDNLREEFEERAGIIEFDAKKPRAHAECLALLDVLHRHPAVLTGVTVLQVALEGTTHILLTTNLNFARQQLAHIGGVELGGVDLAETIAKQLGGLAMLTKIG